MNNVTKALKIILKTILDILSHSMQSNPDLAIVKLLSHSEHNFPLYPFSHTPIPRQTSGF